MGRTAFTVLAEWDDEAQVWYVSESDLPGLAAEAATTEELIQKLHRLVPELVELNGHLIDVEPGVDLPVHVMTKRLEHMRVRR